MEHVCETAFTSNQYLRRRFSSLALKSFVAVYKLWFEQCRVVAYCWSETAGILWIFIDNGSVFSNYCWIFMQLMITASPDDQSEVSLTTSLQAAAQINADYSEQSMLVSLHSCFWPPLTDVSCQYFQPNVQNVQNFANVQNRQRQQGCTRFEFLKSDWSHIWPDVRPQIQPELGLGPDLEESYCIYVFFVFLLFYTGHVFLCF